MRKLLSTQRLSTYSVSANTTDIRASVTHQVDNRQSALQLQQLHSAIANSPHQRIQRKRATSIIQRQPVRVRDGDNKYIGDYDKDTALVKIVVNGKNLFIYSGNTSNIKYDKDKGEFVVEKHMSPYIESWKNGDLVLYRGVNKTHVIYDAAKQGLITPKPDADSDIPEFTSDSSKTRYIPYSTARNIAVMAAKTNPREDANNELGRRADSDEEIGVYVRNVVGTEHSIAIFNEGEIQVLDAPRGHATTISGKSLVFGNRLDGKPLDEEAIIYHLNERLSDGIWSSLGKGVIGRKEPDGVTKMKAALKQGDWKKALLVAKDKHKHMAKEKSRHPAVAELYASLDALASKMGV